MDEAKASFFLLENSLCSFFGPTMVDHNLELAVSVCYFCCFFFLGILVVEFKTTIDIQQHQGICKFVDSQNRSTTNRCLLMLDQLKVSQSRKVQ